MAHHSIIGTDLVRDQVLAAANLLGGVVSNRATSRLVERLAKPECVLESPLEAAFFVWWQVVESIMEADLLAPKLGDISHRPSLNLVHQDEVSVGDRTYRLDFSVQTSLKDERAVWQPIAIELDGHQFHERTRDQVALRDRRDRDLQSAGWKVFHFSYTEFMANPFDMVLGVWSFAYGQTHREYVRLMLVDDGFPAKFFEAAR